MKNQSVSCFHLLVLCLTFLSFNSCSSGKESFAEEETSDPIPHFSRFRNIDASKHYRGYESQKLIAWLEAYKPSRKVVRSLLGKGFYERKDYDVYSLGVNIIDYDELHISYDSQHRVVSAKYVQG